MSRAGRLARYLPRVRDMKVALTATGHASTAWRPSHRAYRLKSVLQRLTAWP